MRILEKFNHFFRNLKHRGPSAIFCPKCGNPSLKQYSSYDSWLIPARYICEKCGYSGLIYMELEKKFEINS